MKPTLAPFLSIALAPAALAQNFSIDWYTIEPGGASQGGAFDLRGVLGQPDAGAAMTGGAFSLTGGFLAPGARPACPADLDDGTGTGTPDSGVTIDDLVYFIDRYTLGSIEADLDDGSNTGTPDSGVTIDDLVYFLQHFADGC